ncbi:putative lipoprotein, partial [Vibrio parahaemolyticus EKP-028]
RKLPSEPEYGTNSHT